MDCEKKNKFGVLLDVLSEAFKSTVSEHDYHMIVQAIRDYSVSRYDRETEEKELAARNMPLTYNPCDHMENIRFGMSFGGGDNVRVQELLGVLKAC